jgi:hypothetical protein
MRNRLVEMDHEDDSGCQITVMMWHLPLCSLFYAYYCQD